MAWVGAVVEGIGMIAKASSDAKAAKRAEQHLQEARDFAVNKSGLTDYANAGKTANGVVANLLNNNGTGAAGQQDAQAAFDNYLNSTGYRFQMKEGQDAIATSAASRGLLNSGATAKALTKFGQGTGSKYFNDYLNQEGTLANRGEAASGDLARTFAGLSGNSAQVAQQGGQAVASDIGQGFQNASDYLGYQSQNPTGTTTTPTNGSNISNIFGSSTTSGVNNIPQTKAA